MNGPGPDPDRFTPPGAKAQVTPPEGTAAESGAAPTRARVQAIRGAITLSEDSASAMLEAVSELLREILALNALTPDSVISAFFSATPDIHSVHPATAARSIGWGDVPMLCIAEMDVDGGLPLCVRVLLHVEPANGARARHAYLRGAAGLRPDLGG